MYPRIGCEYKISNVPTVRSTLAGKSGALQDGWKELGGRDVDVDVVDVKIHPSTTWLFRSYTKHYWDSSVQVPLERVLMGNPWEQHKLSVGSSRWNKLTDFLVFHSPNF